MRTFRIITTAAAVLLALTAALDAQRGYPTAPAGGRAPTGNARSGGARGPHGTEGQATARARQVAAGARETIDEKRGLTEGSSGSRGGPPPVPRPRRLSPEERKRFRAEFVKRLEARETLIDDAIIEFDVLVLSTRGRVRRLAVRLMHAWTDRDRNEMRSRVLVRERIGRVLVPLEELIIHEKRGAKPVAWRKPPGGAFEPYSGSIFSHRLPGTKLTLEALLPLNHRRYTMEFVGMDHRGGMLGHVFVMKRRAGDGPRLEVAFQPESALPFAWKAFEKKRLQWEAMGTRLRIRDGRRVLQRRTVEFPPERDSVVIQVHPRGVNKGLSMNLFDPEGGGS